jgi:GNAT superfamily N-acetyltransferase
MRISEATSDDAPALARLLWLHHDETAQPGPSDVTAFAADLARWWAANDRSHRAFLARTDEGEVVGLAWLALLPRVPRPGTTGRFSADVQSVFVLPDHRGRGIGAALVEAAAEHAARSGAHYVTVHSSRRAVPVYERLGFEASGQLLKRPGD